jgi:hypothetical protein
VEPCSATYRVTSSAEGNITRSHFVAEAIGAETARREIEHNDGSMYPPCENSRGQGLQGGWTVSTHAVMDSCGSGKHLP